MASASFVKSAEDAGLVLTVFRHLWMSVAVCKSLLRLAETSWRKSLGVPTYLASCVSNPKGVKAEKRSEVRLLGGVFACRLK